MAETRPCLRCDSDVALAAWVSRDDHLVLIPGPLQIDKIATDADRNTVTFRASEPYVMTWCSQYTQTVRALNVEIERPTE